MQRAMPTNFYCTIIAGAGLNLLCVNLVCGLCFQPGLDLIYFKSRSLRAQEDCTNRWA